MPYTLNQKGQVTIPKRIRDQLSLQPGSLVELSLNAAGELVVHIAATPAHSARRTAADRFEAVRGCADLRVELRAARPNKDTRQNAKGY